MVIRHIPIGVEFYNGFGRATASTCPAPFAYKGQSGLQSGKKGVVFFSASRQAAEGYAACNSQSRGWVRKYKTKKELVLQQDDSGDQTFLEGDEVQKLCAVEGVDGFAVRWGGRELEIAVCDPARVMSYISAFECNHSKQFSLEKCRKDIKLVHRKLKRRIKFIEKRRKTGQRARGRARTE